MVSYKLDKIDKIVISIIFILGAVFSFLNCLVFATDIPEGYYFVPPSGVVNVTFNWSNDHLFGYSGTSSTYYSLDNAEYIIINGDTRSFQFCFTKEFPANNVPIFGMKNLNLNGSEVINVRDTDYKYLLVTNTVSSSDFSVYKYSTGLSGVSNQLADEIGPGALWDIFDTSIPYILVVVLVGFGIYLIFRMIKGLSKGKGRI